MKTCEHGFLWILDGMKLIVFDAINNSDVSVCLLDKLLRQKKKLEKVKLKEENVNQT